VLLETKRDGDELQGLVGREPRYPIGDDAEGEQAEPGIHQPQGDPEEFLRRNGRHLAAAAEKRLNGEFLEAFHLDRNLVRAFAALEREPFDHDRDLLMG